MNILKFHFSEDDDGLHPVDRASFFRKDFISGILSPFGGQFGIWTSDGLSVSGRLGLLLPVLFRIISILQWLVTHIILILYEIDLDHPCCLDYTRKSAKSLIQFLKCSKVSHLYIGSVQQLSIFIKMEWKLKFQKLESLNLPFIVSRIGLFSPHAGIFITTYASLRQRIRFRCHVSQFKRDLLKMYHRVVGSSLISEIKKVTIWR